jgi:hypothetical protein
LTHGGESCRKFATVLLFAIIQAVVASFVVFLVMADTIGPAAPTYFADRLVEHCRRGESSVGGVTTRSTGEGSAEDSLKDEVMPKENALPTDHEIWKLTYNSRGSNKVGCSV